MADFPEIPPEYSPEALAIAKELYELNKNKKEMTDAQTEKALELIEHHGTLKDAIKDINGERSRLNASEAESIKKLDKINQVHKDIAGSQAEQASIAKDNLAIEQKKLDYLIQQASLDGEITKEERKQIEAQKENVKQAQKLVQQFEKAANQLKEATKASKDMVKSFDTWFSGKGDLTAALEIDNFTNSVAQLKAIALEPEVWLDAVEGGLKVWVNLITDLAIKTADTEANFRRATGTSREFATGIRRSYRNTREFGVSLEEANAAMTSLTATYTDFTMQDAATRDEITETGAVLQKLGVSNQAYAEGIQNTTKMFGVSAGQSDDVMRGIVAHAKDLGVAPEKLSSQFAQMGPQLAKLGSQGEKAFKDIAYISKITGMEMEKVLRITEKFDTFEGAAEQAGKLNAALGGNFVNSMDLMMATNPAERFGMIRDSILDAGLSFDEMSYYQRKYYTEAAGLDDVGELAQMLSGDMDALSGDVGKNADDLIAMKKAAQDVATFQQRLNMAFASMIPILEDLMDNLDVFTLWVAEHPKEIQRFVEGILKMGGAFLSLASAVGAFTGIDFLKDMDKKTGPTMGFFGLLTSGTETVIYLFDVFSELMDDVIVPLIDKGAELGEAMGWMSDPAANKAFIDEGTGYLELFVKVVEVAATALMVLMNVMIDLNKVFEDFYTGVTDKLTFIKEILMFIPNQMVSAYGMLTDIFDPVTLSVDAMRAGLQLLGETLFEYAWGSNFAEATAKLGDSFAGMGTSVEKTKSPLERLQGTFMSVGASIFGAFENPLGLVSTFFETLLDYTDKLVSTLTSLAEGFANIFSPATFIAMAESIATITGAIAEMPVSKALSFTASMAAFAEAGTAFTAVAEAAPPLATPMMGATAIENTTATVIKTPQIIVQTEGAGNAPVTGPTTVSISLDGLDLRKFLQGTVVEKIGELSRDALIS